MALAEQEEGGSELVPWPGYQTDTPRILGRAAKRYLEDRYADDISYRQDVHMEELGEVSVHVSFDADEPWYGGGQVHNIIIDEGGEVYSRSGIYNGMPDVYAPRDHFITVKNVLEQAKRREASVHRGMESIGIMPESLDRFLGYGVWDDLFRMLEKVEDGRGGI